MKEEGPTGRTAIRDERQGDTLVWVARFEGELLKTVFAQAIVILIVIVWGKPVSIR